MTSLQHGTYWILDLFDQHHFLNKGKCTYSRPFGAPREHVRDTFLFFSPLQEDTRRRNMTVAYSWCATSTLHFTRPTAVDTFTPHFFNLHRPISDLPHVIGAGSFQCSFLQTAPSFLVFITSPFPLPSLCWSVFSLQFFPFNFWWHFISWVSLIWLHAFERLKLLSEESMALLFLCLLSLSVAVVAEGESSLLVFEISLLYPWVSGSNLEIPFDIFLVCFSYIWLRFLGFFAFVFLCVFHLLYVCCLLMGLLEVWSWIFSFSCVWVLLESGLRLLLPPVSRLWFLGDSPFCHVNVIGGPWVVLKLMRKYGFYFPLLLWYEDSNFDTSYSGGTRIFSLRGKRFLF